MIDGDAYRKFGRIAQKWRALAEQRRTHYSELYESGRWKIYFDESVLLDRMREVVASAERWNEVVSSFSQDTASTTEPANKPSTYRTAA